MKVMAGLVIGAGILLQVQAGDPLAVIREKGFYKTGAAAKNTSFVEWLKRPVFGPGSDGTSAKGEGNTTAKGSESGFSLFGTSHRKVTPALQVIRDEGYKEKEARMRAEAQKKAQQSAAQQSQQ
ncbi:hypothetical protein [Nitratifractor sp.]